MDIFLNIDNVDSNSGSGVLKRFFLIVSDTKAAVRTCHRNGPSRARSRWTIQDYARPTIQRKLSVAQTNSTQNATVTHNETKNATLAQKEQGKEKKHHKKHNKDHKKKHHKKHHKKDAARSLETLTPA